MREDIKERIELIKCGKVPEGYKKTKLGIIPKDWEIVQVQDVLEKVDNPVEVKLDEEYTQIGIRSHGKGIFYKEPVTGKNLGNKRVFWVEPNCIVVNIVFAWERAVARTTYKDKGMIASHRFPMYRVKSDKLNLDYAVIYFLSERGKQTMEFASPGGAGRNRTLGLDRFMKSQIILPPIDKQIEIVKIMNCIDLNIKMQEHLISLYDECKEWVIEQLVTGKKRLPNLRGKWSEKKLSEVLIERKEYAIKGTEYTHVTLSKEGIFPKTMRYNRDHLVKKEDKEYKITKLNDICYNPANLKFGVICKNNFGEAIFSPIYVTYEVYKGNNAGFVSHYIKRSNFINSVRKYEEGTVYERMSVKSSDFTKAIVQFPEEYEQKQISDIIDVFEKKGQLLKKKRELLELQKKALFHIYITGVVY